MNDKLDPKEYAKYDRTFMAFGSAMNACQHIITDKNYLIVLGVIWKWSKKSVSDYVDELYDTVSKKNEEMRPL